ncbi:MAG TPA: aminotransferase class V-fold PLP-dependent enzyme [Chloroflexota bacterium]
MSDRLAEARALFDPAPGTIYLDSATYGLAPRPTVVAMHRAIDDWQAGTADWVQAWDVRGETCRAAFAGLIGVPTECVALMPSVSVGVATVAATLTDRDEVVVPDDEFTSVLFPILVAARERGASVRTVSFDRLADSVGPRTTLVAFSLVQSQSGRTANMPEIVDAARRVGARTLVDATHAVPFVGVDPRADFVVCAAYKHLLSPRGVAFLALARQHWGAVAPWLANWRSTSAPYAAYYGGPLDLASTAARFDVSLAWFAWAGAAESLRLLVDWQRRGLMDDVVGLARRLAGGLGLAEPVGSVVSVPVDAADKARDDLAAAGIKAAVRAGSVRLSPHVYNTAEHIDRAVAALARFVPQSVRG